MLMCLRTLYDFIVGKLYNMNKNLPPPPPFSICLVFVPDTSYLLYSVQYSTGRDYLGFLVDIQITGRDYLGFLVDIQITGRDYLGFLVDIQIFGDIVVSF